MTIDDDLLSFEAIADPQTYYRRIAREKRVHWNTRWGGWVLTHHADVVSVFVDPRFSAAAFDQLPDQERRPHIFGVLAKAMVYRDPPDHTRLRALINKAFSRRAIESLRPCVETTVNELLDRAEELGRFDLLRELAFPLPVTVIAEFIGVPSVDMGSIKSWSDDIATLMLGSLADSDRHDRADRGLKAMCDYFREVIRERRRAPKDDFASALIAASENRDVLSEEELVGMCALTVFAGHETTTNLLGNSIVALLDHPREAERVREQQLPPTAVPELLRWDGPMKALSRVAKEPVELAGTRIEAGQRVLLALASANRDPERFVDPDRLDLLRADNPHVSFGQGIHYCLGAPLAKLEAQIALESLFRRFPQLTLAVPKKDLRWKSALLVRALEELPVTVR